MNKFYKSAALSVMLGTALCASAALQPLRGYYRIQNAGNEQYVEVTGPFSAHANLDYAAAEKSAGSVYYIEAEDDGTGSYVLKALRSQGIDVAGDVLTPDQYIDMMESAVKGSSISHGLVREGFKFGYTSVARATVGSVFIAVASFIEDDKYVDAADKATFQKDDFVNVAKDFNQNVVRLMDLGIRLLPQADGSLQLYYDVPDLQSVVDWYTATDTPAHQARKATFEAAMRAMHNLFEKKFGISTEIFGPNEIELWKSWGFDVTKFGKKIIDGDSEYIESSFQEIFSNKDFLFNWVKWMCYSLLNNDERFKPLYDQLGITDVTAAVNSHYLTSVIAKHLPALQQGQRVVLYNNTTAGGFDFTGTERAAQLGKDAQWTITPFGGDQKLTLAHRAVNGKAALYLDFPVKATDGAKLFTLSAEATKTVGGKEIAYVTLIPADVVPAQTPFIMEVATGTTPYFRIADAAAATKDNTCATGVLLSTVNDADGMQNMLGLDADDIVYIYNGANAFDKAAEGKTLAANTLVYSAGKTPRYGNRVLIGEPADVVVGPEGETAINGYFRILNLGNNKYVEVSGPFTAKADLDYAGAEKSAGSVFHITAVNDGAKNSYRLTSLRSQGIDVAADNGYSPDSYLEALKAAVSNDDAVYGLVRQGFQYGYTSVARATVGAVFSFVASALGSYNTDNIYTQDDYINVANDFNQNVVANFDLGIRLLPAADGSVQLYYDVPNLQAVVDWYNGDAARKATFESAMDAMTNFISKKTNGGSAEIFAPEDVKLLESWGFTFKPENIVETMNDEGKTFIVSSFRKIFSDRDLLFNWIKMVSYYIINPDADAYGRFEKLGFSAAAGEVNNHYLTALIAKHLPALQQGQRVVLYNNTTAGGFDFTGVEGATAQGDNAKWVLRSMDNQTQHFSQAHRANWSDIEDGYVALYLDFPVHRHSTATHLYGMTVEKTTIYHCGDEYGDIQVQYVELEDYEDGIVPARTPFIMKVDAGTPAADENHHYWLHLWNVDNELPEQMEKKAPARVAFSSNANDNSMYGVLLPTTYSTDELKAKYNIAVDDIYSFNENISQFEKKTPGFDLSGKGTKTLRNEFLYVPSVATGTEKVVPAVVLTQDIAENNTLTGVDEVAADARGAEPDVIYNMQGVRVAQPLPGHIYILNGKKILVK